MTILAWQASWPYVALLFGMGVVLALAEIVIPSGGVLTILSLLAFGGAVVVAFLLGSAPGLIALAAMAVTAPLLMYLFIRVWPHTPLFRRLILRGPSGVGKAGDLAHLAPEELIGRIAVAKTALRPAGKITIDGRRIDCVTEGDLVPAGRRVKILEVHGARVVVRVVPEED